MSNVLRTLTKIKKGAFSTTLIYAEMSCCIHSILNLSTLSIFHSPPGQDPGISETDRGQNTIEILHNRNSVTKIMLSQRRGLITLSCSRSLGIFAKLAENKLPFIIQFVFTCMFLGMGTK